MNGITTGRVTTTEPRDKRHAVVSPGGHLMHQPQPTRRTVVTAGIATALGATTVGALSACSSDGSSTSVVSGTDTAAGGSSATTAATGGAAIVKLADVPVGGAVAATLNGAPVIVAQPTAGNAVAFSAACTHQGCPVSPEGAKLSCSCHGSVFNALTGAVENGPAVAPLRALTVKVDSGNVVAG
jgi:Rieske Fe-S protein